MKISIPFFSSVFKKEKKEYFLALLLKDEKVAAVIFEELNGKIQIKGFHEEFFENSIEETAVDDLLEVLDKAISTAESTLPPNVETQKTVFGLKENWIEDQTSSPEPGSKIKKEYLSKLKKASEALGLSPIGFLVIQEAIAHLMQKEEGAPISAILLEAGKKNVTVSLFRAGRLIETKKAAIEESIPKTCDKILHHFESEILPSRIVIFDEKNGERLQQEFISHSWSKSLSFLHVPQIAVLPKEFDAKAILFGAAVQMGFEMLGEEENILITEKHRPAKFETPIKENEEIKKEPQTHEEEEFEEEIEEKNSKEFITEDFGFKSEEDVALNNKETKPKEYIENKEEDKFDELENIENFELEQEIVKQETIDVNKTEHKISPKINKTFNFLAKGKSFFKFFFGKIKIPKIPTFGNKKIILLPVFAVIVIIASFLFYTFALKATVVLNIAPKTVEEIKELTFSTAKPSDYSKNIINAEIVSISQDGQVTGDVTGKKEVGTQAKGTVTIYNSSITKGRSLPKGTIITSSNNLIFLTEDAVNIASASGDPIGGITSGKAKVAVSAKEIGKEYNLPSGTKFTISSFEQSDVVGKNEEAFSGGTKKEITAVSKKDLDNLLVQLPKNLEGKAKENLLQKMQSDKTALPVFIETSFEKKEFDKKAGDEASEIKLTGTVKFSSFSYKKSDIYEFSKTFLGASQKDLKLSDEGIKYEVVDLKAKNDKEATVKLRIKTSLIPNTDKEELIKEITGKSFTEAEDILLKIPQSTKVGITLSPNLPFFPKALPRLPKNIKLLEEFN